MYGQGYAQPGGYAPAYGAPGGYGAPQQGGYGMGGGGRPRTEPTADDLERTMRTIHVAGIRGLRGQPGINPGEEITEDDLAQFFGNDGEVVGVRINGSNCWIEFADVNGAEVALLKDGTESGGHNLRVSRSKTPIRSNGYAAGRAKQQAALAAKQSPAGAATAAGAPMGTSMAAAAQQHHQSATRAPATQMSPAEIVDSINAALNEAIDAARIAGTLVTPVPPVPVSASAAATATAPATTVVKLRGVPEDADVAAVAAFFAGAEGAGAVNPENVLLTRDPDGKFTGQAFVEFDTAAAAAAALGKDGSAIGERFVEVSASSREEASRNVTPP